MGKGLLYSTSIAFDSYRLSIFDNCQSTLTKEGHIQLNISITLCEIQMKLSASLTFVTCFIIVCTLLLLVKHCLLSSIISKSYYPCRCKGPYIYNSISYYHAYSTEESHQVTLSIVLVSPSLHFCIALLNSII